MKWEKLSNGDVLYWTTGINAKGKEARFGKLKSQLIPWSANGQATYFAWLGKLVCPGLVMATRIFKGLQRPLQYGDDSNGAKNKYVYSWTPTHDYEFRDRFAPPVELPAPPRKCFMVIVTPNAYKDQQDFEKIDFWIEHWTWVESDDNDSDSPSDFENRFDDRLK